MLSVVIGMLRKFSVVNACMCCTEVLSRQAKDRNKRKSCSVISSHRAQTDVEMLESKERPCSATWSRRMQAAAASLSALCTMLHRVPARKYNHSAVKTNVYFTRFDFVPHACSAVAVHAVFRVLHAACRETCSVLHARARITGEKSTHTASVGDGIVSRAQRSTRAS